MAIARKKKNPAAVLLGRKGGQAKSPRKTAAARDNALISALKRRLKKERELLSKVPA